MQSTPPPPPPPPPSYTCISTAELKYNAIFRFVIDDGRGLAVEKHGKMKEHPSLMISDDMMDVQMRFPCWKSLDYTVYQELAEHVIVKGVICIYSYSQIRFLLSWNSIPALTS